MKNDTMILSRRRAMLALAAGLLAATQARAQGASQQPLRILVGYAAGGGGDLLTRLLSNALSQALGRSVVIENKPGAGGTLAAATLASAPADGSTVYMAGSALLVAPAVYDKINYDPLALTPVLGLGELAYCVVVHPSFPAHDMAGLIQVLKANPGKYDYASPGIGNIAHLSAEMFQRAAGVEMVHVPYKSGAPALADLVGGQIPICFVSVPPVLSLAKTGKLRILGVTTAQRSPVAPDVPTIAETLPGFDAASSMFVLAPPGTPRDVVARLADGFRAVMNLPDVREGYVAQGASVQIQEPDALARQIRMELDRWAKVAGDAGIKPGA